MNERIGTLLNRSGGEFYEGFLGSPNTIKFTEEELNTFAKLIVQECAFLIQRQKQRVHGNAEYKRGHTEASDDAVEIIKKYFGVEE